MSDISTLLEGIENCPCGKPHACPVDGVYIGKGALAELPNLCRGYRRILVVTDENIHPICGEKVLALLGKKAEALVLRGHGHVVVPDEAAIARIEEKVTGDTDLIIGVGSGVINDLCKYVSFQKGLPYMIAATAPSMDGYASVGAALILGGMKVTPAARPPKVILGDTDILKNAPMAMLQSGWGDIVGKYSCLNDWKLSALLNGEYFCQRVYDLVMATARQVEALASGVLARDEKAVAALMEALVTVGIAMSYVGNSRTASGSEHHLSHYFEITGIVHGTPYYPHGTDVLYASAVTARLRELLIRDAPKPQPFDAQEWEKQVLRVYGSSAQGVLDLQRRLGWHEKNDFEEIAARWEEVLAVLREAPGEEATRGMAESIGLSMEAFDAFYGTEKITDGIGYAKDLKDRYSVLWLFDKAHAPIRW